MKEGALLKTYDEMKPLYVKTDVPNVGLLTTLLLTREGKSFPIDEASKNNILPVNYLVITWNIIKKAVKHI